MKKERLLQTVVDPEIDKLVKKLANVKGMTISEYLRNLIISDLDSRMIFTTIVKRELDSEREVSSDGG